MPRHARPRTPPRTQPLLGTRAGVRGAVRGLMNPWFATAAGVMIAASLWVYHPHAQLTLPFATPSASPCTPTTCTSQAHDHRSQASTGGQRLPKHHARRHAGHAGQKADVRARSRRPRRTVGYLSWPSWQGSQTLRLMVPVRQGTGWTLTLTLPGDTIRAVEGMNLAWHPTGANSVAISVRPGASAGQGDGTGSRPWDGQGLPGQIVVVATGPAASPAACVLNGASCIFKAEQASHAAG